jgi:RNA polymerase sigma-70 factor (ECF subfamily)
MARWSQATSRAKLRLVHPEAAAILPRPAVVAPLDDNELLGAVRCGDDSAATALYHRVRPQIDATIARMLGRQDADVEDVAQLALIELVRSIHQFRGECSLDTWVSRITAHVVCKQIRRRRIERGVFARTDDEPIDGARPGSLLVARDLLRRIRSHLDTMDQDRALAFLLHDVCGFDLREAARMLDVSVAAAQKRLMRGRRELRERMGADPELADMLARTEGDAS